MNMLKVLVHMLLFIGSQLLNIPANSQFPILFPLHASRPLLPSPNARGN
jgi:hypothetical protein